MTTNSMLDPGNVMVNYTSYAGSCGTWQLYYQQDPIPQSSMNGLFYLYSAVKIASITDGTSNTILLGEKAHTLLNDPAALNKNWWASGNFSDSLFCTLWPMNSFRRVDGAFGSSSDIRKAAYIAGASSLHPGGCNFGFADGSVRFLKDSIQTWPYDNQTGMPVGVTFDPAGPYKLDPAVRFGVYQALSTRSGGEVISADQY
jgi:prepilin-type processing-associated H-X9-DG protein